MRKTGSLHYRVTERWLRGELTALREQLGWSRRKVAVKAGLSLRTIERIENGPTPISAPNLSLLCDIYDVPAGKRAEFYTMRSQANKVGWWDAYRDLLSDIYAEHCEIEYLATAIALYAPTIFHGLVQSPAYAAYVQSVSPTPAFNRGLNATRFVQLRLDRQKQCLSPEKPVRCLVDETIILRRRHEPIEDQISYVLDLESRGLIETRVLPLAEPSLIPDIFVLSTVDQREIACVGGFLENHIEDETTVKGYKILFETSWNRARSLPRQIGSWT